MAYTVEAAKGVVPTAIDLSENGKHAFHYGSLRFDKRFVGTETVEKIFLFDPRRDKAIQINTAQSDTYTIETTITAGEGNADITASTVPWTLLQNAITTDFQTGAAFENRNILAVRVTSGTPATPVAVTGFFDVSAIQTGADDREG